MRFESPWALLVLLAIPVVAYLHLRRRRQALERFAEADLRLVASAEKGCNSGFARAFPRSAAILAAVAAASCRRGGGRDARHYSQRDAGATFRGAQVHNCTRREERTGLPDRETV